MKVLFQAFLTLLLAMISADSYSQDYMVDEGAVRIDGLLSEGVWNQALEFENFRQISPGLNVPEEQSTKVYLLYSSDTLYVGIKSFEVPGFQFASVDERDQPLEQDDYVEIIIDANNDKSSAAAFRTNPIGARYDYEIADNGENINNSWNTFWDVATSRSDSSWIAEFSIPFSSLRYNYGGEVEMGLRFVRFSKQRNEKTLYPLLNPNISNTQFSQVNVIEVNFSGLESKVTWQFTPYVTGSYSESSTLNSTQTDYFTESQILNEKNYASNDLMDKGLSNLGLDVKFRNKSGGVLDLTLNTDFAQTEADDRIINLTRFSVNLPEKRLFFLENAGLFSFDMFGESLFYSRRIGISQGREVPVIAGIRYTGESAGTQIGVLNMQTNGLNATGADPNNYSVFRVRKPMDSRGSYIGGMLTNILNTESGSISTKAGADGIWWLNSFVNAHLWAVSDLQEPDAFAFGMRLRSFPSEGYRFDYRYRDFRSGFDPGLGFLSRPDTKRLTVNQGYSKVLNNNPFLARITIGGYVTHYWRSSSNLFQFLQINAYSVLQFENGYIFRLIGPVFQHDKIFNDWNFDSNVTIPMGNYKMMKYEPFISTGDAYRYQASVSGSIGDFFGGVQYSVRPSLSYIFNRVFNLEAGVNYNHIRFPDSYSPNGKALSTRILYSLKSEITLRSDLVLSSFIQYDNLTEKMGSNLRLRFNPKEGVDLYVIFNQNLQLNGDHFNPERPILDNRGIIFKYSHTFLN